MTPETRFHDVHSRFARSHLRTREERAVYFTFVAQLAASWSAAEIAALKDLDLATVAAVLHRYASAGIVQTVDTATGRRYRWQSDMSYLYGTDPDTTSQLDPVCGMKVHNQTPHRARDASGRIQLFCSAFCASIFTKTSAVSRPTDAVWTTN